MLTLLYSIALLQASETAGDAADGAILEAQTAETQVSEPPPVPCSHKDYDAFDFWVGEWDVFVTGRDEKVGESLIERVSAGCAIRETWKPIEGADGTSLTLLNHRTNRWDQTWIGGDGKRVDFTGGMVGPRMVLAGYWDDIGGAGRDGLIRMTFTPHPDGSVRQFGEASGDQGLGWVTSFDFTYRRKSSAVSGEQE